MATARSHRLSALVAFAHRSRLVGTAAPQGFSAATAASADAFSTATALPDPPASAGSADSASPPASAASTVPTPPAEIMPGASEPAPGSPVSMGIPKLGPFCWWEWRSARNPAFSSPRKGRGTRGMRKGKATRLTMPS